MNAGWVAAALFASAVAQSVPTLRDVFSAKIQLSYEGFGLAPCQELFPATASVTYTPPAAGFASNVDIPATSISINKTVCDAAKGFSFRVKDLGVDGEPTLNLYAPPENLVYMYGSNSGDKFPRPMCNPHDGGLLQPLLIRGFVVIQANKPFQMNSPIPSNGALATEPGVKYFFVDFGFDGGANTAFCVFSDRLSLKDAATDGGKSSRAADEDAKTATPPSSRSLSAGAIAGIACGALVLIACLAAAFGWAYLSKRKRKSKQSSSLSAVLATPP
jgi:hypothetical protein